MLHGCLEALTGDGESRNGSLRAFYPEALQSSRVTIFMDLGEGVNNNAVVSCVPRKDRGTLLSYVLTSMQEMECLGRLKWDGSTLSC